VLVIVVAALALFFLARPLATGAIVQAADDHDTLLRQSSVRAIIAPTVEPLVDVPADPNAKTVDFTVRRGANASQIAADLLSAGLIKSALAFKFVLFESGTENALQTGTYKVSAALSPRDLATLFQKAPGDQVALRIIEGWRLTEVAVAVNKAFPSISAADFTAAAVVGTRNNFVLSGLDPKTSLEGFLFPDTYFLRPDATADQIIGILLDNFETKAGPALRTAAAARSVAIYDMVKLASIVEREARDRQGEPDDRRRLPAPPGHRDEARCRSDDPVREGHLGRALARRPEARLAVQHVPQRRPAAEPDRESRTRRPPGRGPAGEDRLPVLRREGRRDRRSRLREDPRGARGEPGQVRE